MPGEEKGGKGKKKKAAKKEGAEKGKEKANVGKKRVRKEKTGDGKERKRRKQQRKTFVSDAGGDFVRYSTGGEDLFVLEDEVFLPVGSPSRSSEKKGEKKDGGRKKGGVHASPHAQVVMTSDAAPLVRGFETVVGDTVCVVCRSNHDEADVLLCEDCGAEFHRRCLRPPLGRVPAGLWVCHECAADRILREQAKDFFPKSSPPPSHSPPKDTPLTKVALETSRKYAKDRSLAPVTTIELPPSFDAFLDEALDASEE